MNRTNSKRFLRYGAVLIGLMLAYYVIVVLPRAADYRRTLQSLQPEQVQTLRLRVVDQDTNLTHERILKGDEVSRFLSLISGAAFHFPNHPHSGWSCSVDIDTTASVSHFSFVIHASTNDGVQISLMSNGNQGRNYGTLRNDSLKPFVESLFPFLRRSRYQLD